MGKMRTRILRTAIYSALISAAVVIYKRRRLERVVSPEGLDDPDVARGFERISHLPHMAVLRWLLARRIMKYRKEGTVLDIGCGPGLMAVGLAGMAPGLTVIGIDLSEDLLDSGSQLACEKQVSDRVTFKLGDAANIPFEDGSLDMVVSTLSMHHWQDPSMVFNEVSRVLRDGGSFLVFDLRRDMIAPAYLLIWFATHVVVPKGLKKAREPLGSRNAAYTPYEAAELLTRSELVGWKVSSGPFWLLIEGKKETLDASS